MHTNTQLSDAELTANRCLIASAIAGHPFYLQFSKPAAAVLASVAAGDAPISAAAERRLLRDALAVLDAAELALGQEVAA